MKPETYLVLPDFSHLFKEDGLTPVRLRLAVRQSGNPVPLGYEGAQNGLMTDHYIALQEAADEAEKCWVKLEWNNGSRAYDYHYAEGDLGEIPNSPPGHDNAGLRQPSRSRVTA